MSANISETVLSLGSKGHEDLMRQFEMVYALVPVRVRFDREAKNMWPKGYRTGTTDDETGDFIPTPDSLHCAGALIYLEKRNRPHQMMRIAERLGMYDRTKLDMEAGVV